MRRGSICTLTLLFACSLSGLAGAEVVHKSAPADPRGEVEISNVAGEIEVRAWDRNEVDLEADLGRGVERLEFESEGNRTRIKVVLRRQSHSGGTDLRVRIPEHSSLTITSVSADVTVEGVRGVQRLQSVSGDIDAQSWGEDVEIKTVSGELRLTSHGEHAVITANSVSGDVTLTNVAGELVAATVSGDLRVRAGPMQRMKLQTTSGDMIVRTEMTDGARYDVETINGDLNLDLAGEIDAEFDIKSFNGDIEACFGPEAVRTSRYGPGRELRFSAGNGAGRIRINSLNGDIDVCDD